MGLVCILNSMVVVSVVLFSYSGPYKNIVGVVNGMLNENLILFKPDKFCVNAVALLGNKLEINK